MRAPRARLMPRTMRGKLIAGLLALLTAACASVGLTSYIAVKNSMFAQLDTQLQTATNLAYKCEDEHPGDPDDSRHQPANEVGQDDCPGLATGTLTVAVYHGTWGASLVPDTECELSAEDKRTLSQITPTAPPAQQDGNTPTHVRTLESAGGSFVVTSIADPDGDGTVYITGLPLSGVNDSLKDLALTELAVFAAVLLTAGAGGTFWVRLSLRPLRRVAATAAQVAELPLETGEVELPAGVTDTDPVTETGQVGAAFNRMLGHVQRALERRAASEARLRRFAADASHELRTPLSSIRGYAELALRHPGNAPDEVTHALSRVLSESTRMSVLVDDLLLLARLDAGRPLNRDPVDVTRLAIDVTSDARVARPDHRWVLELPDDPVQVRGDEHRLHQVLANLLSNAGRHTPAGTKVIVSVRADTASPDDTASPEEDQADGPGQDSLSRLRRGTVPAPPRAVITVRDEGPGIPPGLVPDLFERFTRADTARSHASDASASAASTGLGLAIVDAVVAALGGAVLVATRPGMTRFTIVLPRISEDPGGPEVPGSRTPASRFHGKPARKSSHRV